MKNDIDVGGEDDRTFQTDTVQANRDIERGLGVGARELAAQRDAKGAVLDADEVREAAEEETREEDA